MPIENTEQPLVFPCKELETIFAVNASGVMWEAKHDNLLPLVEFAREQEQRHGTPLSGQEETIMFLRNYLKAVSTELKRIRNRERMGMDPDRDDAGERLCEVLEKAPYSEDLLLHIYDYLLDGWDTVKGWSITYRVLFGLTKTRGYWDTDFRDEIECLKIIKSVRDEW